MTKTLTILTLVVVFTTVGFTHALDLKTPPKELALQTQKQCNFNNKCIERYRNIYFDIITDDDFDINFRLNMLFVFILLTN